MAKKATLITVPSYLPGATSASSINTNDSALNNKFTNTISRDGSTPNTMNADFDMNGNDILNVGEMTATDVLIGGVSFATQVTNVGDDEIAAAASAAAAASSETAAATSETAAAASAVDAAASAVDAAASAVAADTVAFHGVRVYKTAGSQTISSGATTILFDTDDYDTFGMHDVSTNTSKLVADVDGYWNVFMQMDFGTPAVKYEFVSLRLALNSGSLIGQNEQRWTAPGTANEPNMQVVAGPIFMSAGDDIQVQVLSIPNGTTALGRYKTAMTMYLVGIV